MNGCKDDGNSRASTLWQRKRHEGEERYTLQNMQFLCYYQMNTTAWKKTTSIHCYTPHLLHFARLSERGRQSLSGFCSEMRSIHSDVNWSAVPEILADHWWWVRQGTMLDGWHDHTHAHFWEPCIHILGGRGQCWTVDTITHTHFWEGVSFNSAAFWSANSGLPHIAEEGHRAS